MADDSSVPPLSRRVPGATNRPKPKMRITPPVLPEELIGRLRPNQATTTETTATPPKRISGEAPAKPERQVAAVDEAPPEATVDEAPPEATETWYVVPDSPASPVADSNDTTQPIPMIAATSEAPGPVKVMVDVRKEQLPRRGGGSRSAGPARSAGPSRSARTQPASRTQHAARTQAAERTQPADRPGTRDRQRPAGQRALPGKPAPKPAAATAPASKVVPGQPRIASFWRKWAASRSRPQQQREILLRPLFRESLSIEEMVASVRAQAAGRRADQGRRYRRAAVVLLVVVVAVALVVVAVI